VNAGRSAAPDAVAVFDGPSHRGSSLVLYADVPVRWLHDPETELAVRSRGVGRDRFLDEDALLRRWGAGERLWLVTEAERVPHWTQRLGPALGAEQARSGTRLLFGSPAVRAALAAPAAPEHAAR